MSKRHYVEVEVDAQEILDDMSDDELISELNNRLPQYDAQAQNLILQAYNALCHDDKAEALTLLERALWPRWGNVMACRQDYDKHKVSLAGGASR